VGPGQARLFRLIAPPGIAYIRRGLGIDRARTEKSLQRVRQCLDELQSRIDGRRYLFGERFTAADLTLASLLAPVFLPSRAEGYAASLPRLDELAPEAAAVVESFRQHPVGQYCSRLFAMERDPRGVSRGH
jgi:glutathione S-transferase